MNNEEFLKDIEFLDPESQRLLRSLQHSVIPLNNPTMTQQINYGEYTGQDPFEGIGTDKTFQEMSNEVAMDSPFGKKSVFYRELREILTGQIPKL